MAFKLALAILVIAVLIGEAEETSTTNYHNFFKELTNQCRRR